MEILQDPHLLIGPEELFVGPECLCRGAEALLDPPTKVDLIFDPLVADEVHEHLV